MNAVSIDKDSAKSIPLAVTARLTAAFPQKQRTGGPYMRPSFSEMLSHRAIDLEPHTAALPV
jgi:hypothetical protein